MPSYMRKVPSDKAQRLESWPERTKASKSQFYLLLFNLYSSIFKYTNLKNDLVLDEFFEQINPNYMQ